MKEKKLLNCFAIMPFSETEHLLDKEKTKITSEEWNHIYNQWIKKAVESYTKSNINCKRSETIQGNFVKGIIKDIYNCEIAIVDLTGQKPNVYYELGIRHSLRLGTIIITQDFNALPSDLKSYYCFSYQYSSKSHEYEKLYQEFEKNLHFQIDSVIENFGQADNPVADFLDLKHYNEVQEKEKQTMILFKIINELQFRFAETVNKFKAILDSEKEYLDNNQVFFTFIDFGHMDNSISQLFNLEFEHYDIQTIEKLKSFYLKFRKELYNVHQYWEGTRANIGRKNLETLFNLMRKFLSDSKLLLNELTESFKEISKEGNVDVTVPNNV